MNGRSLVAEVRSQQGMDIAVVLNDTSTETDINLNQVRGDTRREKGWFLVDLL